MTSPAWTTARYRWHTGGGAWAATHGRWAAAPGRRYPRRVLTARGLGILYHGYREGLRYVLPFVRDQQERVAGEVVVTDLPAATWGTALRGTANADADIVLIGCSGVRAARLPAERSLVLPFRVHLELEVDGDPEAMLRKVSRNERRQFTTLRRRHQLEWEVASGVDDLAFFWERMHLPTMASRHGEQTRSTDWETARRCLFEPGRLFFVTQEGKRVAGVLCHLDATGEKLTMRLLGALDGDETHYRSGAVKAAYYLTVEWAARNGVRRIDFSGADPFPGRGVYQFKRRFHPTAVLPGDHFGHRRVWLGVRRDTDAVRDFLVATPMLAVDGRGELTAVHFFDRERPARTDIRADGPGVTEGRVVDLEEFLARRTRSALKGES